MRFYHGVPERKRSFVHEYRPNRLFLTVCPTKSARWGKYLDVWTLLVLKQLTIKLDLHEWVLHELARHSGRITMTR
jgi:hypothetical protein